MLSDLPGIPSSTSILLDDLDFVDELYGWLPVLAGGEMVFSTSDKESRLEERFLARSGMIALLSCALYEQLMQFSLWVSKKYDLPSEKEKYFFERIANTHFISLL